MEFEILGSDDGMAENLVWERKLGDGQWVGHLFIDMWIRAS